jgi:glycosyltransferase involved in cell wall biosynthesis
MVCGGTRSTEQSPRVLVIFYANPDSYPPTRNAVHLLRGKSRVRVLSRNVGKPFADWPADVEILRIGLQSELSEKFAEGPIAKAREFWNFIRATRESVESFQPSVIYAYDPHAYVASLFGVRRVARPPVVFHLHELPELHRLQLTSLQDWITRYALLKTHEASIVVFPEKYRAESWLSAARVSQPAVIVPNCASLEFPGAVDDLPTRAERRWSAKDAVLVGGTGPANGQLEAIRALALSGSGSRLVIVGALSREFASEVDRAAHDAGVAQRVSCLGWVAHQRLPAVIDKAAVGLCLYRATSLNHEFNASATNKLFEYISLGLPVVVPDRQSYRDFFGSVDWLRYADVNDPRSIARAIADVLADRERYVAMSLAARRAFEERFNYEHVFAPLRERILALAGIANGRA